MRYNAKFPLTFLIIKKLYFLQMYNMTITILCTQLLDFQYRIATLLYLFDEDNLWCSYSDCMKLKSCPKAQR